MHPALDNLSVFTWMKILETEEAAIKFAEEVGLIPQATPSCSKCGAKMKRHQYVHSKIGFRWVCSKKNITKKNAISCKVSFSPLANTFFKSSRIPIRDVLALVFCFVRNLGVNMVYEEINIWRKSRDDLTISKETVCDYYFHFRQVCQVISYHDKNRTGELDQQKAEQFYRSHKFDSSLSFGEKVGQFIKDIISIYPGYGKKGLSYDFKVPDVIPPNSEISKDTPQFDFELDNMSDISINNSDFENL